MFPHHSLPMPPPQKPETFMLSSEAQQSLPQDAQVALQQVDNRMPEFLLLPLDWTYSLSIVSNNSEILPPLSASGLAAGSIHQTLFAAYGRLHFLCALVSSSVDYMIYRGCNSGCGRIVRLTPVTGAISSIFPEPILSDAWLSDSKPLGDP